MSDAVRGEAEPSLGFERVVYFSDAVFAIVITLLVLPLTADVDVAQGSDIAHEVWRLWPRMLSFVVSFLVIGQFWIAHHRMFGRLRGYDTALVWLNLISLLSVCFLPFPTAVLGARSGHDQFPVIFYAVSMTVTSLFFTLTSLYALSRLDLVKPDLDRRTRREYAVRSVTTTSVFAVSVGAAYFGLYVAMTFWLVVLPVVRRVVLRHSRGPAAVSQEAP